MAQARRAASGCAPTITAFRPRVNAAIRELILRGRLNATSVMMAAPHFDAEEADALDALNAGEKRAALGLHVTLTAPFKPMSEGFAPLRNGRFLPHRRNDARWRWRAGSSRSGW